MFGFAPVITRQQEKGANPPLVLRGQVIDFSVRVAGVAAAAQMASIHQTIFRP